MSASPDIREIIKRAGGAVAIQADTAGEINAEAVYKWPKIGVPDRHWPVLIRLAGVSADDLLQANIAARAPAPSPETEQAA